MKTAGKLMAKSRSQPVNLPDARPLMNPLYTCIVIQRAVRSCPHYARQIWNCSCISMGRPTFRTTSSWKQSFLKMFLKPDEFEKAVLYFSCIGQKIQIDFWLLSF